MKRRERWRPVVGFPGYEVSDRGRLRSYRMPGRARRFRTRPVLLTSRSKDGYRRVTLCNQGDTHHTMVHTLVLRAFVGPVPPGQEGRHKNGRPGEDWLENLRYGTRKQNMQDAVRHGTTRPGERNPGAKLTNVQAAIVRRRAISGENYGVIAADFGISRSAVCLIRKGHTYRSAT